MAGVDHCDRDCITQRLAPFPNVPGLAWDGVDMYHRILVPVENRKSDQTILSHIRRLAKLVDARLILVHVADGWAARNYERFGLQESEEMKQDRQYLSELARELESEGYEVKTILAMGDPATEIIKLAKAEPVDLIA